MPLALIALGVEPMTGSLALPETRTLTPFGAVAAEAKEIMFHWLPPIFHSLNIQSLNLHTSPSSCKERIGLFPRTQGHLNFEDLEHSCRHSEISAATRPEETPSCDSVRMTIQRHPSESLLLDSLRGAVSDTVRLAVIMHLALCKLCRENVELLEPAAGTFRIT